MNDHELEERLKAALGAKARAEIGDRRTPPPIDWPEETRHRRRWVAPLAIAASVVLIGAAALASNHLRAPVTVATNTPPPVTVTVGPTTTGTTTTVPSTTAPPSTTTTTPPASTTTTTTPGLEASTVTITGARVVPAGWLSRSMGEVISPSSSVFDSRCLVRSTRPTGECTILFGAYPATRAVPRLGLRWLGVAVQPAVLPAQFRVGVRPRRVRGPVTGRPSSRLPPVEVQLQRR